LTLPATTSDTLVGKATTDILTNKTLTSPVLTTPSISNINAKGDILVGTADNTLGVLSVGTNTYTLVADSAEATGLKWAAPAGGTNCAVFIDQKTSTAGGTFTSGAWRTRDINTSQFNNITGASIASKQITLPSGTFMVVATAPFQRVDQNALRFQNITDTSTTINGQNAYTDSATAVCGSAYLSGTFTIAASKTFELQHRCVTTRGGDGFGPSNSFTTDVYAVVSIWKVG
jgi:hypothetical protein